MTTNSTSGSLVKIVIYCTKCGKPKYHGDPVDQTVIYSYCDCPMIEENKISRSYGWQCPVCGEVNAPWVAQCPGYHGETITTNGNVSYPKR